mmetsp:Transcript_99020/g.288788  ORF Transcript_99020/g.288788 Transcript_99020/m.288788 type:complete len:447 (+) Transcript_99020:901-2241(+)
MTLVAESQQLLGDRHGRCRGLVTQGGPGAEAKQGLIKQRHCPSIVRAVRLHLGRELQHHGQLGLGDRAGPRNGPVHQAKVLLKLLAVDHVGARGVRHHELHVEADHAAEVPCVLDHLQLIGPLQGRLCLFDLAKLREDRPQHLECRPDQRALLATGHCIGGDSLADVLRSRLELAEMHEDPPEHRGALCLHRGGSTVCNAEVVFIGLLRHRQRLLHLAHVEVNSAEAKQRTAPRRGSCNLVQAHGLSEPLLGALQVPQLGQPQGDVLRKSGVGSAHKLLHLQQQVQPFPDPALLEAHRSEGLDSLDPESVCPPPANWNDVLQVRLQLRELVKLNLLLEEPEKGCKCLLMLQALLAEQLQIPWLELPLQPPLLLHVLARLPLAQVPGAAYDDRGLRRPVALGGLLIGLPEVGPRLLGDSLCEGRDEHAAGGRLVYLASLLLQAPERV